MIDIKQVEIERIESLMCSYDGTGCQTYLQAKFWVGPVISEGFYYDIRFR